ncbi:MAG: hypothetical protein J6S75_04610, partial [Thermoguttaceae bacterium]|nr:hypothetical protein [Thermoguttaceae bacterium]
MMTFARFASSCRPAAVLLAAMFFAAVSFAQEYKGPVDLVPSPDGSRLYVLEKDASALVTLNAETMEIEQTAPIPEVPHAMALSADGAVM